MARREVKKVSPLISEQLPSFVREQHPNFVHFLEAYYEWLEVQGNQIDANKNLLNYNDIDCTLDEFVTYFKKEFLATFPEEILADKRKLLKKIRQFYRAKGTEKSYKLLFNVLYNSPVEFYYPWTNMLRLSDGKWQQDKTLRVSIVTGDPFEFTSTRVIGRSTNASAYVDEVKTFQYGPFFVYELFLNRSSILGMFEPGEIIFNENGVEGKLYHLFGGLDFDADGLGDRGINYAVGEKIIMNGGSGFFGEAEITSVGDNGEILKTEVTNYGINYEILPDPNTPGEIIYDTTSGINAYAAPIPTALTEARGYYINDDGKLNSADRIQDGFFYQQFSYVIYVSESIDKYRQIVKDVIHPAGLLLFGGLRTTNEVNASLSIGGASGCSFIRLEFPRTLDPLNLGPELNVLSQCSELKLVETIVEAETSYKLGASVRSLERQKFYHAPSSELPDSPDEMEDLVPPNPNNGYWDLYGNYQIDEFLDVVVGDFIGWDFIKLAYDPNVHTAAYLDATFKDKVLTNLSGTKIYVVKYEFPRFRDRKGLMTFFFEYEEDFGISESELLWVDGSPGDQVFAANSDHLGFQTGWIKKLNIQPEPRLSINQQAEVPPGHVW